MVVKEITSTRVVIDAPAKINLFLQVLGKRPDGFHNIRSLIQAVSLFDTIVLEQSDRPGLALTVSGDIDLSPGPDNLICRAFDLMKKRFRLRSGLNIRLTKRIPVAAGLGGGSSDCAATIAAVNLTFGLGLSDAEMAILSLELGSDMPFFFSGGQAMVSGRGETIEAADYPTDYAVVLVCPDLALSTAQSYALLNMALTDRKDQFSLPRCQTAEGFLEGLKLCGNDFESVHFKSYPVLDRIKRRLVESGAKIVRMSGSGPTMFGLFEKNEKLGYVEDAGREGWRVFIVEPVTLSKQQY